MDSFQVEKRLNGSSMTKVGCQRKSALKKVMAVLMNDEPASKAKLDVDEEKAVKPWDSDAQEDDLRRQCLDEDLATGNAMVDKLRSCREGRRQACHCISSRKELVDL
jgi:hypothetical protein